MKRIGEITGQLSGKVVSAIEADPLEVTISFTDGSFLRIETDGRDGATLRAHVLAVYTVEEDFD